MGRRISSHSRFRFDLPFSEEQRADPGTLVTTGAVGPMTRKNYVETFWRVAEIRVSGSITVTFTRDIEYPPTGTRESASVTAAFDVTLRRKSVEGTFPTFTLVDSDEGNVFTDNLALGGKALFSDAGVSSVEFSIDQHLIDGSGDFWLKPDITVEVTTATSEEPAITISGGHMPKTDIGLSTWDYEDVSMVFPLSSGDVAFPVLVAAFEYGSLREVDDVLITAATADIEITEWLPYADTAGLAAWDTLTGLQTNGGPAA